MSFNLSICPAQIDKYCSLGDVVNDTLVSCNSSLLNIIIFKIINIITITIIITIYKVSYNSSLPADTPLGNNSFAEVFSQLQACEELKARMDEEYQVCLLLFFCFVFVWQILANTLSETKVQITPLILRQGALLGLPSQGYHRLQMLRESFAS